ncbi:hypothetical protein FTUN_0281 [Frigoriglobus tundricola]|uniref:Uncharacterized protein n=1 Tax=Frigoriglobus tundricola TaxID=2774151 RepID=A0A6M5YGS4_9BACT|nr:hypothetical protein FTUN_0281 [Frigoriglobus tundricola]
MRPRARRPGHNAIFGRPDERLFVEFAEGILDAGEPRVASSSTQAAPLQATR